MSDNISSLRRQIDSADDLQAVVRTMKAMAASSIGQYENAVRSLDDYYRTVQLGLSVCLRQAKQANAGAGAETETTIKGKQTGTIIAIVFGSDQGLVGQFNDLMEAFVLSTLQALPGKKTVWAVGERILTRLADTALKPDASFALPTSIAAITPLVGHILLALEAHGGGGGGGNAGTGEQVLLFHNRPKSGAIYSPVCQRFLPLDDDWRRDLTAIPWPTNNLPQVLDGSGKATLLAFVREYLFVSLFRTCAESLASENASRLAAMQRAEKNIDELLDELTHCFNRQRQSGIDAELFDVVAGFEALSTARR
jgi:F-type H+-transporting ATPase subunit gamma